MTPAQFLELIISLTFQAAIVVMVTQGLCQLLQDARTESRLWTAGFVVLLLLAVVASFLPHLRMLHPWRTMATTTAMHVAVMERNIGRAVFLIWFIGAAVSGALTVRSALRTTRFIKSCRPVGEAGTPLGELLAQLAPESLSKSPIQVFSSPQIASPFCWQFHRPQIVLPEFLLDRNASELRFVIRHELEHLRTGHPVQLFLQRLVEIVFWFHPMVWWASQQSSLIREYACDDAVADTRRDVAGYLRVLLVIAERGHSHEAGPKNVLAFGRGPSLIARRGRRLLECAEDDRVRRKSRLRIDGALTLMSVVAIGVAVLLWFPIDVLASPRTAWSPWPRWTASVLHTFAVPVRDFEPNDGRANLYELTEQSNWMESEETRP